MIRTALAGGLFAALLAAGAHAQSNGSVGTVNQTAPGAATQIGVQDGSGKLQPITPTSGFPVSPVSATGVDGSTTITTGGTAQALFSGATPVHGYEVCNPDPSNDLWISDTTTAAANGQGSIRVALNGGCYTTPVGFAPPQAVSIVGPATGQKITARKW